jgi:Predicted sugar phosphatases of the HAD superfamily
LQIDEAAPLVAGYDGLIVEADGVLFRGPVVVDHAVDSLTWVSKEVGLTWGVVRNDAAHAPRDVAAKLQGLGFDVDAGRVITSPQGAARLLGDQGVAVGAGVLVVGGPGIDEALQVAGFAPVRELDASGAPRNGVAAVVQGFGPDLRWADLAQAAYAIEAGALWVATNGDLTLPTAEGLAPGNRSMRRRWATQ